MCLDIYNTEGEEPECLDGQCRVPEPDSLGRRAIEMRSRIIALQGLVDGGHVLKMYEADLEDLEMLAVLEETIKDIGKEDDHG